MGLKSTLWNGYERIFGFRTDKKLLVIESDDWGSERSVSDSVKRKLNKLSSDIQNDLYTQYDNLEDKRDIESLCEVLNDVKDCEGNPCVLTANFCVANPDFEKIRQSDFNTFYYKDCKITITEKNGQGTWSAWKHAIHDGIIVPQLHGREHVHALTWLSELKAKNTILTKAFQLGVWGVPYSSAKLMRRKNLQASLDIYGIDGEEEFQYLWIEESFRIFQELFCVSAKSFIAPAYTWHDRILPLLAQLGIESLQGIRLQYSPKLNGRKGYNRKPKYMGQKVKNLDIVYFPRNCFFEPTLLKSRDVVGDCLKQVDEAFQRNVPSIIGTHRLNYIGSLCEENRSNNLKLLRELLHRIKAAHPEVRFISSNKLASLM